MKRIIIKFSPVFFLFLIISINCKKSDLADETVFTAPIITECADSSVRVTVEILEVGVGLKKYGFCYGLNLGTTIDDDKTVDSGNNLEPGIYTELITGLYPNTTYYIKTYAEEDTIHYGMDVRFTTSFVINFPDANFEQLVRDKINKPTGNIYASDVNQITELYAYSADSIASIAGIQHFTQLQILSFYRNQISDISALSGLTNLTELSLISNQISDISALSGLTNLTTLSLEYNQISDISGLFGLTNLNYVSLYRNQISDISPITGLTNLTTLYLGSNQISDISALAELTKLKDLSLDGNSISDISTLAGLTNLTFLTLGDNSISDISSIAGLTDLTYLWLGDNQISDISSLSNLTNLTFINLAGNQISDISALSGLINIRNLWLHINQISNIYPLVQNSGLDDGDEIGLNDNPLSTTSINDYIPILQGRGVTVGY